MKYILVDYFDTLCFRHVHPHQVIRQWAKVLLWKFPAISQQYSVDQIIMMRKDIVKSLRKDYEDPPFEKVMTMLYRRTLHDVEHVTEKEFIVINKNIFIAVELGCQYANKRMIKYLRRNKKAGKKIYIVSDYYLPQDCYDVFLRNMKVGDLFDGIFVSESCNKTKRNCTLYQYVLENIGANPADCLMIGDNRHSDVDQARAIGIKAKRYFPYKQKLWGKISRRINYDFGGSVIKIKAKELYGHTLYEEYSIILYYCIYQLFCKTKEDNVKRLAFFSRGGYFLQILFDEYQRLVVPEDQKINSDYCYNSRIVCYEAENDKDKCKLLNQYLSSFCSGNRLCIVDEGWYNHCQELIAKLTHFDTYGYYIGTRVKNHLDLRNACERTGLLYDTYENGKHSPYYSIFCTNHILYEQMLTSREGSVVEYVMEDGEIMPRFHENAKELTLYDKYVKDWQNSMLLHFKGLTAWMIGHEINISFLAKMILKTSFFADKKRLDFLNFFNVSRVYNYKINIQLPDKPHFDEKVSKWGKIINLIAHPNKHIEWFCCIQRNLVDKPVHMLVYYPIAYCYYWYVRLIDMHQ